ncbi:motility associated factor glycosyltransferase family protein [Anaerosporobacter sp.]|uniref:motility associated factor glycosyltransferase family protein n=1 Tax=Anaerosporobacter sp. TaxID=1872529 RepID=UPI00286ECA0C|nr:6-hydroxymethylpterin diphosphokinase MptE-like protein [Anaerosporobacter sp.]
MSIKNRNIEAITKGNSFLCKSLRVNEEFLEWSKRTEEYKSDGFYEERAKDNNLVTYICGDKTYRLNSMYYPEKEAEIWAKPYQSLNSKKTNRIFWIFGLGNGYFIRELIRILDAEEILLIYEPSKKLFFHVLEKFDLADILKNEKLTIGINGLNEGLWQDARDYFREGVVHSNCVYLTLPQYDKVFAKERENFNQSYTDFIFDVIMDECTIEKRGKDWGIACIDNASIALRSSFIGDYRGNLKENIPVIVVAAGPSLKKNVHMIKKAKGKALILAVDTALNYLAENDIIPDAIVTLDVHKPIELFNNEVAKQRPMFVGITANPSVIKMNESKKIFFDQFKFLDTIRQTSRNYVPITISGCVATMAFEIARYIGAKTIILVGQNLAFEGNSTHVGQWIDGQTEEGFALVEGNYEKELWTRKDWYSYLLWYNKEVASFDGVVINATEGGAKIDGTRVMSLEEAIEQYCKSDFDAEEFINKEQVEQVEVSEIEGSFNKLKCELEKVGNLALEAIELCEYLIKENQTVKEESYVSMNKTKRLSSINKELNALGISTIIEAFAANTMSSEVDMLFERFKEKSERRLNIYKRAMNLYQSMSKASDELMERLEDEQM